MHSINRSLPYGQRNELRLDSMAQSLAYKTHYHKSLEKVGIDRIWEKDGHYWSVEYKTDQKTATTGNVFIETVSVDMANKPGWAISSKAEILVYFMPGLFGADIASLVFMSNLRAQIETWKRTFRTVGVANSGMFGGYYTTYGVLVPLGTFMDCCHEVIQL